MNYIFELPSKHRIVATSAEDAARQICKGHFLTSNLTISDCMKEYAEMIRNSLPNLEIPTDTAENFINALVRIKIIKWIR